MKKIDWFNVRKWSWPINAFLYNIRRVVYCNRDKRLWVFGAKNGLIYDDNCRHLFEYLNLNHSDDIKCVWLCENETLADRIRSNGYTAYTFDSDEGVHAAKHAGVAIYSHGLSDFGAFPHVAGATIVSLWHGVGFKKIYNVTYRGFYKLVKWFMDSIFSWIWRDLSIVTSEFTRKQFAEIFGVPISQTVIAGQPRNDVFKKGYTKQDILSNTSLNLNKKIVLYMPTYRGFSMDKDSMVRIVKELYDNETLNNALNDTNSIFVAKLHPNTPHIDIEDRENFVVLDYKSVNDNQALLGVCDMLVTDYSSCFVDYALLNRPIIFYMPDEEEFFSKAEPMYDEFFSISNMNKCTDVNGLAIKLANPSLAVVKTTNDIFEDRSIKGTCYSENVYKAIIEKIRLKSGGIIN